MHNLVIERPRSGSGIVFCRAMAACLVYGLLPLSDLYAFDIVNRWSSTQLDGGGLQRGDPVNLRWSVVPDGRSYDRSANSNLIQFLDDGWLVPAGSRTADFTNRPWWTVINNAYVQFERTSGVRLNYIDEQNAGGVPTGTFGDIRIGGEGLDGTPGGALADNTFPDAGDMRIDTTRESNGLVGGYFATEPGLRNLVIHETGHGVGLGHTSFPDRSGNSIMEGGIRTDFWGLQFDDVYALNRQYGDPQEQNGGNDSPAKATVLGSFGLNDSASVGLSASDGSVGQFDADWLGIDGSNDSDWFRFTVGGESFARVTLAPQGPAYTTAQQGFFNAAAQSDLILQLFATTPTLSRIANIDAVGIGETERIAAHYLPSGGDYLLRVLGKQDANQFYQIDLNVSDAPFPGSTADLNLDGASNVLDWGVLVGNLGTTRGAESQLQGFRGGDLNFDGAVDYSDFSLFRLAYSAVNGGAAFEALLAVPEPGSASLALCVLALLSQRRFRKRQLSIATLASLPFTSTKTLFEHSA